MCFTVSSNWPCKKKDIAASWEILHVIIPLNIKLIAPVLHVLGKTHTLTSIENMTSSFSYKWIPYNSIVEKTGICMKFIYKMTGENNTLSLSFETLSSHTTLVWRLHGNHGDMWKSGFISYRLEEPLAVIKLRCLYLFFFVFLNVVMYEPSCWFVLNALRLNI